MHAGNGAVLIVEDDRNVACTIGDYLTLNGYAVDYAADGTQMRERLVQSRPDVVLMDIGLPQEDGWTLLQELRRRYGSGSLGIIMLTIRDGLADLIRGLDGGADDYVAKPFRMPELASRIGAVMRRCGLAGNWQHPVPAVWRFGDWHLDRHAWKLSHIDGTISQLTGGEFALLDELLSRPHQTIDRESLSQRTRQRGLGQSDRSMDVMISNLRQKLREDARAPLIIRTVRGQGYQLSVDVHAQEN